MLKVVVVCGMGLGSSHYILSEVIKILKDIELDADVENTDLFSAADKEADIYIGADYIMNLLETDKTKIYLEDLLDEAELRAHMLKLKERL